jgi:hypothetical protein
MLRGLPFMQAAVAFLNAKLRAQTVRFIPDVGLGGISHFVLWLGTRFVLCVCMC